MSEQPIFQHETVTSETNERSDLRLFVNGNATRRRSGDT